jgi:hypothetical protein
LRSVLMESDKSLRRWIYLRLNERSAGAGRIGLSRVLHNLSCHLRDDGGHEEALAIGKESVALNRHLGSVTPASRGRVPLGRTETFRGSSADIALMPRAGAGRARGTEHRLKRIEDVS